MSELKTEGIPYFMSANAIFEIGLGGHEMLVYFYLSRCGNNGSVAFPSYTTIAKKCAMSKRKAMEAVQNLVDSGLVRRERRKTKKAKENLTNIYTVIHSAAVQAEALGKARYKDPAEAKADLLIDACRNAGAMDELTPEKREEIVKLIKGDNAKNIKNLPRGLVSCGD